MNIICDSSDQMQMDHHSWLVGSCHIHQIPGVSAHFLPPLRSMFREPPLAMTKPYFWPIFVGPGTSDENPDYPDLKRTKFIFAADMLESRNGQFRIGESSYLQRFEAGFQPEVLSCDNAYTVQIFRTGNWNDPQSTTCARIKGARRALNMLA